MKKKIALMLAIIMIMSCMSLTTLAVGRNHYDLYIDRASCRVHVYYNDVWLKVMVCDVGKPSTPTPKGTFYTGASGFSFGMEKGYMCKYATVITGNYLFHTVIFDRTGKYITDGRLGMQISHGCVRLAVADAQWICNNIPRGTKVSIR